MSHIFNKMVSIYLIDCSIPEESYAEICTLLSVPEGCKKKTRSNVKVNADKQLLHNRTNIFLHLKPKNIKTG